MKRLSDGHEVNALFRQRCSFSSAGNALKMRVALQQPLASFPHLPFGSTAIPGFRGGETMLSEYRTQPNIGDDRSFEQLTVRLQGTDHGGRIVRAIACIILHPIGKSFRRVHHRVSLQETVSSEEGEPTWINR